MSCPDCISGKIHTGTPTGTVTKLYGLDTYIAEPPEGQTPKGIIVIIPDAFGWELPNNRLLADAYASSPNGPFKVLLPDFMRGHWAAHHMMDVMENIMSPSSSYLSKAIGVLQAVGNFIPFLFFNRKAVAGPVVHDFFTQLAAAEPGVPVGAAGFCWGGKWTTLLCSRQALPGSPEVTTGDGFLVDAGFAAHPSALEMPKDVENAERPLSIAHAGADINFTNDKADQAKRIFDRKEQHEIVVYEGAKHGFAVRANPDDPKEKKQLEEATEQAVKWFSRQFDRKQGAKL